MGSFAVIFLPEVVKYLPFHLATSAFGSATGGFGNGAAAASARVDSGLALILLGVWFVGSLAVAAIFAERAEVLG